MTSYIVAVRFKRGETWYVIGSSNHDSRVPPQVSDALEILQRYRENGLQAARFSTAKVLQTPEGYIVPARTRAVRERIK